MFFFNRLHSQIQFIEWPTWPTEVPLHCFTTIKCFGGSEVTNKVWKCYSATFRFSFIKILFSKSLIKYALCYDRYYDAGSLSDQQMALLQYQRENLHYLSEEVLNLLLLDKYSLFTVLAMDINNED